jgi:uncharacterized protein (TIGR03083 family)
LADASRLAPFDPFDIMDEECARIEAFFASRDDAGWKQDTRCEGWDVRDLLAHLASVEAYNRACLDEKVQDLFAEAEKAGAAGMNEFNAWQIDIRRDRSAADVLDEWRNGNEYFRTEMRKRGRDGSLETSVGPYPAELQAFHLGAEYATHADDMDVPVPESARDARLAWRKAFSLFGLEEAEKDVTVESSGADNVVRAGDKEITLSDHELVEAVTARLKTIDESWQDALRALA